MNLFIKWDLIIVTRINDFFYYFPLRLASIDCNIAECKKPIKIYEELHCKPIYGAKSCCPKRFECPENSLRYDANKCLFDDKFYKIGEVLNFSNKSTCLETCICSRSVAVVTFNLSLLCFKMYFIDVFFRFADTTMSQRNFCAQQLIATPTTTAMMMMTKLKWTSLLAVVLKFTMAFKSAVQRQLSVV